jgi:hypothetical protein
MKRSLIALVFFAVLAPAVSATAAEARHPAAVSSARADGAGATSASQNTRVQVSTEQKREPAPPPRRSRWARFATAMVDVYAMKVAADR